MISWACDYLVMCAGLLWVGWRSPCFFAASLSLCLQWLDVSGVLCGQPPPPGSAAGSGHGVEASRQLSPELVSELWSSGLSLSQLGSGGETGGLEVQGGQNDREA